MSIKSKKIALIFIIAIFISQQAGIFQYQFLSFFSIPEAQAQLGGDGECIKQILSAVGITSGEDAGAAQKNAVSSVDKAAITSAQTAAQTADTASVPVGDRGTLAMLALIAQQNSLHSTQSQAQSERHQGETSCTQVLRDLIVKRIVDYMTDQIIQWIQGGGTPQFVSDWSGFTNKAENLAFDSFNSYLSTAGVDLCSPFVPQIQLTLQSAFVPQQYVRCSIDDFKRNISNSLNLVQNGGWLSYTQAFMPQGSFIGMEIYGENQIIGQAISKKNAAVNEAISSNGFLGQKECTDTGAQLDADTQQAQNICQGPYQNESDRQACISQAIVSVCKNVKINTPGDVVAKAATQAIDSKFQYAENVQSIISALVNTMIDKLVGYMKDGLSNAGSQVDATTNQSYDTLTGQLNQKQIDSLSTNYQQLIDYFSPVADVYSQALQIAQSFTPCDAASSTPSASDIQIVTNGLNSILQNAQTNMDNLKNIDPNGSSFASDITAAQNELNTFETDPINVQLFALLGVNDISSINSGDNVALQQANVFLQEIQSAQATCSP